MQSHQVHIFRKAWKKMISHDRSKTSSSKNAFKIIMKNNSKLEKDSRSQLFSLNCPIRCGTSGYSYKRFVNNSTLFYFSLPYFIQLAYGSNLSKLLSR